MGQASRTSLAPGSRLVSVHWRASTAYKDTDVSATQDSFVAGVMTHLDSAKPSRQQRCQERLAKFARTCGLAGPVEDAEPEVPSSSSRARRRRHTIFNGEVTVCELPYHKLLEFFQARMASFDINSRNSVATGVSKLITDSKHCQILDVMVLKEVLPLKQAHPGLSSAEVSDLAVRKLVHAFRCCDYSCLEPQVMDDLRKVALAHLARPELNVLSFVESRGAEALNRLEYPHLHRLLYGVLRVPGAPSRLECMSFEATFAEHNAHCANNLKSLNEGLQCLHSRSEAIKEVFFVLKWLCNKLNAGSSAPVLSRGFKLCGLQKFSELRSPVRKDVSLLHYAVLWISPRDLELLTDVTAIETLSKAQLARAHTVYLDMVSQLEGFNHIRVLVQTGSYKGQEIQRAEEEDDRFHQTMSSFVQEGKSEVDRLWKSGCNVFRSYMSLGQWFGDINSCYPPPKDAQDDKLDLFSVMHQFFACLRRVSMEVADLKLAEEIAQMNPGVQLPMLGSAAPRELPEDKPVQEAPAPSPAISPGCVTEPQLLPPPPARQVVQKPPEVPKAWVLGAEPLVSSLFKSKHGVEVVSLADSPLPVTTPTPTPSSPRARQNRKSLSDLADRTEREFTGQKVLRKIDTVCEYGEDIPVGEDLLPGPDLNSQLSYELRRRKSRGWQPFMNVHSPPPYGYRSRNMTPPLTPENEMYPLTPVTEKGETPFRLNWTPRSTPKARKLDPLM